MDASLTRKAFPPNCKRSVRDQHSLLVGITEPKPRINAFAQLPPYPLPSIVCRFKKAGGRLRDSQPPRATVVPLPRRVGCRSSSQGANFHLTQGVRKWVPAAMRKAKTTTPATAIPKIAIGMAISTSGTYNSKPDLLLWRKNFSARRRAEDAQGAIMPSETASRRRLKLAMLQKDG